MTGWDQSSKWFIIASHMGYNTPNEIWSAKNQKFDLVIIYMNIILHTKWNIFWQAIFPIILQNPTVCQIEPKKVFQILRNHPHKNLHRSCIHFSKHRYCLDIFSSTNILTLIITLAFTSHMIFNLPGNLITSFAS